MARVAIPFACFVVAASVGIGMVHARGYVPGIVDIAVSSVFTKGYREKCHKSDCYKRTPHGWLGGWLANVCVWVPWANKKEYAEMGGEGGEA